MSYWAGSYRQLLFGVSQQVAKDRVDGQNEEQLNMTSDLVTGPRKRAPVRAIAKLGAYTDPGKITSHRTNIGGEDVLLLVNTATGKLQVIREVDGTELYTSTNTYLLAASCKSIRFAGLGEELFIANTSIKPTEVPASSASGLPNPARTGYAFVQSGAYAKVYNLSITRQSTGVTTTVSKTTSGSDPADAQPETIMTALTASASANGTIGTAQGFVYSRVGAYLFVSAPYDITISTDSGSAYMLCSNASSIRDTSQLPANLPQAANGYVVAVGTTTSKSYYRWENGTKKWVEDAAPAAQTVLQNMPLRLSHNGTAYLLEAPAYERRASGDTDSNPSFAFTRFGITGFATMQGRLIILSNEYVCASGSDKPLRWYRSSVASLLDSDPWETAANAAVSSPYEYAVQFNKDLILFAKTHQGIVPGSALLTPRTAVASVATQYSCTNDAGPAATGRSVFFVAPRSQDFGAVWEMVPSQYTDAQVQAEDVTMHIPRYVKGPFRFVRASTTSNIVVFGTADRKELLVHEYLWQGAEKAHAAWHRWTFKHDLLCCYFASDRMVCLFGDGASVYLCELDLRIGAGTGGTTVGRLDFYMQQTCSEANVLTVPSWFYNLHDPDQLWLFKDTGVNPYLRERCREALEETVGPDIVSYALVIPDAAVGEKYTIGSRYTCRLAPTRPILKDRNEVAITTERTQLHRLVFSLVNTGEVVVTVSDAARDPIVYTTTPLRLYSRALGAGEPLAATATVTVPCRVDMQSAKISIESDDVYDLNIASLEYGFRYNQRYRR